MTSAPTDQVRAEVALGILPRHPFLSYFCVLTHVIERRSSPVSMRGRLLPF